jgi:hypothetical protein
MANLRLMIVMMVAALTYLRTADAVTCYVSVTSSLTGATTTFANQTGCTYCQKTVASVSSLTTTTKSCVAACTSSYVSAYGVSNGVYCCQNVDFCNGASGVAALVSLIGAAAMLALCALRR